MRKKINRIYLFSFLIMISTLFLGIGYASISDVQLDVTGTAMLDKQTGVVISSATYSSNNNANTIESKINTYYQSMLSSKIVLGNTLDSTITYQIQITNLGTQTVYFDKVNYDSDFYDNNDITFELTNLNVNDPLPGGATITFDITFKYLDDLSTITNSTLNSYLNFIFKDNVGGHTITYDNTIDTTNYNYPTSVVDHGTVSFYFQGTKPSKVYVDGNLWKGYNLNTGRLVLDDITSDIVVSADFTPVNLAIFDTSLSSKMRNLAGSATNVTAIRYADTIPAGVTPTDVKANNSQESIYMWYDNGVIYWNCANPNPSAKGSTLYQLFSGYSNLSDISGLETWDISGATTMLEIFKSNAKLADASPLRYWDTSSVTNMRGVFNGATLLSNIKGLDNWDVSNVIDMNSLFVSNYSLVDISPLAKWNIASAKSISGILQECRSLTDITPLTNWNTSNVTEMIQLLQNTQVSDLTPLANWDVRKVTDMRQLLFKCTKVTTLEPLSNWQTNSLQNLNQAFAQVNNITNLHGLENWNVSSVTNFSNMCDGCTKINTLEALQNWNVSSGTNFSVMFYNNNQLTATGVAYVNNWVLNPSANFNQMFNRVNNKPTFMFDVNGVPTPGTWSSNGTLIPPS